MQYKKSFLCFGQESNLFISYKVCDLSLGTAIYNRIKEVHPNIDDNTAFSHFKYAINHIKYVPVSESRKVSRAKRLSLQEDFNNWVSTHDSWKNRKND